MNTNLILPASLRELKIKPRDLRKQRKIPAEYYGRGKENLHLALDYQTFRKVYKEAGKSSLVDLKIDNENEAREILIHEVSYDPLTDRFQHIDLKQIERNKKIYAKVYVRFEGVSPAIKDFGGIFTHGKTELEIHCLPRDLVKEIVVDISTLKEIGNAIKVKDLNIDRKKIAITEDENSMIATILAPKSQEELDADLAGTPGAVVSEEVKAEAEAEKAAAQASKESDKEKKGGAKEDKK